MSLQKYHSSLKNSIIQIGRVDHWSTMNGGGFDDSQIIGQYRVDIQNEDDSIRMFIWSNSRPCINISLSLIDYVAVMDGVYYHPTCSVNGKMERGEGTLEFAIDFIKSKGAKEIQLADNSTVTCNGKKIRLGLMYFFKFGKTWYETYFGFKPTEKYREKYENAKRNLILQDKPCDYFTDDILDDLSKEYNITFFPYIAWTKSLV